MSPPPDCPEFESWQARLADPLSTDRQEDFERHLESCPACQELIDRAEEGEEALRRLARQVGDPTVVPADPTLAQALESLHEVKSPPGTSVRPADLYFLRPSDRPGVLGTLGDYQVLEVVGQGGMGVVLKALDPSLDRLVAIKVMSPALAGSATARRRFTREARAAAAVCHEHVVAVHGVYEIDGLPYLVMQYVAGESLQDRLDRIGPLEVEEAVRIGMQAAAGLAAAHAQGLIHRDIKPANLLLEDGLARVKVTDFGLARMADGAGLTRDGVVAGTPEYMAPEQARGEPPDHRADLYGLGGVLYACCTGGPPFGGGPAVAVLRRVSDEAPAPIRARNADVPAWLEALVARLLAKDPAERFGSAAEVAALLERYLAHVRQPALIPAPELPGSPSVARPGKPVVPQRLTIRNWVLLAVGLVGVLGLLAALAARLVNPGGAPAVDSGAGPAGQWAAGGATSLEPADGLVCLLVNKNSGRCLSIADGSADPGAKVVQGPTPDLARATERWTLLATGNAFRLRNESSGLVLAIGWGNRDPGVAASQWPDLVKAPSQLWTFEPAEDSYVLRAVHSQLVLGIRLSSQDAGGQAVQWNYVPDVLDQCWALRPAYREEVSWPLRGDRQDRPPFDWYGPGAEQGVGFEPAGLRIALPPGKPEERPETGLTIPVTVKGDFEITIGFEILKEPATAAAGCETRFALTAVPAGPEGDTAAIWRESGAQQGDRFLARVRRGGGAGGNRSQTEGLTTTARSGRLRLVRAGTALSYYASQAADGPFTFLRRYPFGDQDLKAVRITGAAGPEGVLDVRATDLRIRADSLPIVLKPERPVVAAPQSGSRAWWVGSTVPAVVVLLLVAAVLGLRLFVRGRRRRKADTPPGPPAARQGAGAAPAAVSIVCSGCGKRLKATAALAGKKLKCPGCGQAVCVPPAETGAAATGPSSSAGVKAGG